MFEVEIKFFVHNNLYDLLVLMVRTKDDMLSKKIQLFLHAYHYSLDQSKIMSSHDNLLYYVDHAMKYEPVPIMEI